MTPGAGLQTGASGFLICSIRVPPRSLLPALRQIVLGPAEHDLVEGSRPARAGQAQGVDADRLAEGPPQVNAHHLPVARHLVGHLPWISQLAVRTIAGVKRNRV